jgi:hypothetical protein
LTEYFIENPTTCLCEDKDAEFRLTLLFFEAEGNTGTFMGNEISWEKLSCSSISFTGESSGVLEDMIVPEEGILEFTMILDSSEPAQVSCCCNDLIIIE